MVKDKVKLTVEMEVTTAQALALEAMFDYWNTCGNAGMSRKVAFFADGDHDFHPNCKITITNGSGYNIHSTKEIRELAISSDLNGDRLYDYDSIACKLASKETKYV